ncbi:MAG: ATP-binding protein [Candidatus Woesearchaeota archaeon]
MKMTNQEFNDTIIKEPFSDILGQIEVKKNLKSALLMNRHMIIVGSPGIGKTTLAKNVTRILPQIEVCDCGFNCMAGHPICPSCIQKTKNKEKIKTITSRGEDRFIRVQGSPDLTAEDLLGDIDPGKALQFGPLSIEAFSPGKVFRANNGILFFDEVNRCSEKLQNALLQVLEERKVTIGSYTVDFPAEFIFIGTMNPEDSSTETLSDVFLDRFDMIYMHHPESLDLEKEIVLTKGKKIDDIEFSEKLVESMIQYIRDLRQDPNIEKKPSVRSSIGVYERAQSYALLSERDEVTAEDIHKILISVLSHRVKLKPSIKYLETTEQYLEEQYSKHKARKGGST